MLDLPKTGSGSSGGTGAPTAPYAGGTYQDEQGYTLLPNGNVLTISVWDPPVAQVYTPSTGVWTNVASTPVSLIDPTVCGNYEIGPAVTRPDGTVVAWGNNALVPPGTGNVIPRGV